jgi:outer membrane protein assembly factor BamB
LTPSKIVALDVKTGSVKWSYNFDGAIRTTPTVTNGVVYIGVFTDAEKIYALDANTGLLKWQSASISGFSFGPSLAYANGLVYMGSYNGMVYAFDANNGTLKWSNNIAPGQQLSSPSVSKGILYINTESELYALDATAGNLKWQYSLYLYYDPVIYNGKVYVTGKGKVYCFAP